jgi:DNA-directed DNA polymerase III PolC
MLLNVHSHFSLRYGILSIEALVDGLVTRGYDTAVLTDINNSSAVLKFVRLCRDKGLNGLAGMEFRNEDAICYIGIARNEAGFKQLNEWRTYHNLHKQALPENAPELSDVYWVYPFGKKDIAALKEQEYIGVRPAHLNKIRLQAATAKYVIWQPVTFSEEGHHHLHKQLRAIDHNLLISQLSQQQYAEEKETFPTKQQLLAAYKDFPEIIRNTAQLLSNCSMHFNFETLRNKQAFTDSRYNDKELLQKYALEGWAMRYGVQDKQAEARVHRELQIIDDMHFSAYFLITNDICRHATQQDFHYIGRGSGANSIVAYCMGITDVCPMELNLYFERFLNPKRKSPPDFDIDFSWRDRDAIYDYIFSKYPNTALLGAMSTFRGRSIIRELGKIYGLPKSEIDLLVRNPEAMQNKNEVVNMILALYNQMESFPNQRTIHASGILISEEPLTCYSALDYPPKALPTVQYDMYGAEDINLEKFDILSQRGLGHIKDAVALVQLNKGETIDVHNVREFFKDDNINRQLKSGDTVGCFYIESPAMRQLISKLKCDNYLTLVAASSIIRPGVASSGMMKAYIERHHDPQHVEYLHPVMKEQLEDTYGVMVYQEDVMRIGHYFGGLDMADADVLRRMMSGKKKEEQQLSIIASKFFLHCAEMQYPEAVAKEVWRQMESFAGYSFNKAHSASYAVESYQSLFLKTYYPLEFMVAVVNNHGGFYRTKVYLSEVRKAGATLHLPCINKSDAHTNLYGSDVYLGLELIANLEHQFKELIPLERQRNGAYTGMEDLHRRTGIGLEQLIVLIRTGALRFMNPNKKELLWEAHLLLTHVPQKTGTLSLFETQGKKARLPLLETSLMEDLYDEIELIGYPVSASRFDMIKTSFRGDVMAGALVQHAGKTVRMLGDFVADKKIWTKQKKFMKFGTFLDAEGAFFDTVHFPPTLQEYPLYGDGIYLIQGKIVLDFGYPTIEVEKIARVPVKPDPRSE